jgi:hypothetical protein
METAKLVFFDLGSFIAAVLMPTIFPLVRLISGPPELPLSTGASVCRYSVRYLLVTPETIPRVPV